MVASEVRLIVRGAEDPKPVVKGLGGEFGVHGAVRRNGRANIVGDRVSRKREAEGQMPIVPGYSANRVGVYVGG